MFNGNNEVPPEGSRCGLEVDAGAAAAAGGAGRHGTAPSTSDAAALTPNGGNKLKRCNGSSSSLGKKRRRSSDVRLPEHMVPNLKRMLEMGFPRRLSKKALLRTENAIEAAVTWTMQERDRRDREGIVETDDDEEEEDDEDDSMEDEETPTHSGLPTAMRFALEPDMLDSEHVDIKILMEQVLRCSPADWYRPGNAYSTAMRYAIREFRRGRTEEMTALFLEIYVVAVLKKHLETKVEDSPVFMEYSAMLAHLAVDLLAARLNILPLSDKLMIIASQLFAAVTPLVHYYRHCPPLWENPNSIVSSDALREENSAPFGLLIDLAERFISKNSLEIIRKHLEHDRFNIKDLCIVSNILADIAWLCDASVISELMLKVARAIIRKIAEMKDQDLRNAQTREDAKLALRHLGKGLSKEALDPPPLQIRLNFLERLLTSGFLEAKISAINELVVCMKEPSEPKVKLWMKRRRVLHIVLSDNLDNNKYVEHVIPLLTKMAPLLSESEFRMVWSLQKGRQGMSVSTFDLLIAALARGFSTEQKTRLFQYFRRALENDRSIALLNRIVHIVDRAIADFNNAARYQMLEELVRTVDACIPYIRMPHQNLLPISGVICQMLAPLHFEQQVLALQKCAKEICKMKELDPRFPFFMSLMAHTFRMLRESLKLDANNRATFESVPGLLRQMRAIEKSGRQQCLMLKKLLETLRLMDEETALWSLQSPCPFYWDNLLISTSAFLWCEMAEHVLSDKASDMSSATLEDLFNTSCCLMEELRLKGKVTMQLSYTMRFGNLHHLLLRLLHIVVRLSKRRPLFRQLFSQVCHSESAGKADADGKRTPDLQDYHNQATVPSLLVVKYMMEVAITDRVLRQQTDLIDDAVSFLWSVVMCGVPEVRMVASTVLLDTLCRKKEFATLIKFAADQLNDACREYSRITSTPPFPEWNPLATAGLLNLSVSSPHATSNGETGEQPMEEDDGQKKDVAHDSRRNGVAEMKFTLPEVASKKEAEDRLFKVVFFLKKSFLYCFDIGEVPRSLLRRDNAMPGERFMVKFMFGKDPLQLQLTKDCKRNNMLVHVNEQMAVVERRLRRCIPKLDAQWNEWRVRHDTPMGEKNVEWSEWWKTAGDAFKLTDISQQSPFNEQDTDVLVMFVRREHHVLREPERVRDTLPSVVFYASGGMDVFWALWSRVACAPLHDELMDAADLLPLEPFIFEDYAHLSEKAKATFIASHALDILNKPYYSMYQLYTFTATVLPPLKTERTIRQAHGFFRFLREASFPIQLVRQLSLVDLVRGMSRKARCSLLEIMLVLTRFLFLSNSSAHSIESYNKEVEHTHVDSAAIAGGLHPDDIRKVIRCLRAFAWSVVVSRGDAEEMHALDEINRASPTGSRLVVDVNALDEDYVEPYVRMEEQLENGKTFHLTPKESSLVRGAVTTILHLAKFTNEEEDEVAIFNEGEASDRFWKAVLLDTGSVQVRSDTLSELLDFAPREMKDRKKLIARLLGLVDTIGKDIWGPQRADAVQKSGQGQEDLLRFAKHVVSIAEPDMFDDRKLAQWVNLEKGFVTDAIVRELDDGVRARHLAVFAELIKHLKPEPGRSLTNEILEPLICRFLFPFSVHLERFFDRKIHRSLIPQCIGVDAVEGEMRRRHLTVVTALTHTSLHNAFQVLEYVERNVHGKATSRRDPKRCYISRRDPMRTVGLKNVANTCYMNTVLQQLFFIPGVNEALFRLGALEAKDDVEADNSSSALIREMQNTAAALVFSIKEYSDTKGIQDTFRFNAAEHLNVREQNDCFEFFLSIVDKCDVLLEKMGRPAVFRPHFEGVTGYEYFCKDCGHRHRGADETFNALNLELHGETLEECLEHYMDGALLEGESAAFCEQCRAKRTTLRLGSLRRCPETLIIQLKRFAFDFTGALPKLNRKCEFPMELDLSMYTEDARRIANGDVPRLFQCYDEITGEMPFMDRPASSPHTRYQLVGVIIHIGQLVNGHYTTYVKERRSAMRGQPWYGKWLYINDAAVNHFDPKPAAIDSTWFGGSPLGSYVQEEEGSSSNAYLLVYEKIEEPSGSAMDVDRTSEKRDSTEKENVPESTIEQAKVKEDQGRLQVEEPLSAAQAEKDMIEWVDIGWGRNGPLSKGLLELWKLLPEPLQLSTIRNNLDFHFERDVHSLNYVRFVVEMLLHAREFVMQMEDDEDLRQDRCVQLMEMTITFCLKLLWRSHARPSSDEILKNLAETEQLMRGLMIISCRSACYFIDRFLDEGRLNEEGYACATAGNQQHQKVWWNLITAAMEAVNEEKREERQALCREFVRIARMSNERTFTLADSVFVDCLLRYATSQHGTAIMLKSDVLSLLLDYLFLQHDTDPPTYGVRFSVAGATNGKTWATFASLIACAIATERMSEHEYREFLVTRFPTMLLVMCKFPRETHSKLVEMIAASIQTYGPGMVLPFAQAVLLNLKIDSFKARALFGYVMGVAKTMSPEERVVLFDEILSKREREAAEDGTIQPGVVSLLEHYAEKAELLKFSTITSVLSEAIQDNDEFGCVAVPVMDRLSAANKRAQEEKDRQAASGFHIASGSSSVAINDHAFPGGSLDLIDCCPLDRPTGTCNSREKEFQEQMLIDDEDDDDEEDECLTDEDEELSDDMPLDLKMGR